jgi:hypothetical protein
LYVNTEPTSTDGNIFHRIWVEDYPPPSKEGLQAITIPRLSSRKYIISGPVRFGVLSGAAIPQLLLRYTP